ncbi:family 43 glycosylhydrolase [Spirosoma foliorum]|uniref:Family 43 glycosylhydrolase n=1 Tax=Spirosoma foliorum TaxID=2710596 RepID=A0A7G5GP19_9BACT|nr:family 43 glycosylhydrolase [Spirosoma foliorum]QMW00611.1 family 43 glycosylhydrolase [Spirosoma foliorum]
MKNALYLLVLIISLTTSLKAQNQPRKEPYSAYLFAYFTGNSGDEEAIRFAISKDGYNYKALNYNEPIMPSAEISSTGGVRDPHILRGQDGKTLYMVVTDMHVAKNGWGPNVAMVLLRSTDLVHWKSSKVDVPATFAEFNGVNRVWAPQTIYDPTQKKYMIYWSMRFGNEADKIYYAYANADFTGLETAPKLLFTNPAGGSCIDADIVQKDGQYHLFYKTEGSGNGIKKATSTSLTGPFTQYDTYLQQTTDPVEGSSVFKLINSDKYVLMYDVYTKGRYEFTESTDLTHFKKIDGQISMNFKPRHGTIIPITQAEEKALTQQWALTNNPVLGSFFADPEILFAQKTGKFYLYPTSDGFDKWSGNFFKTFSSDNLVDWNDEGTILDLPKQVSWANRNAWAPCIIEKKIDGQYKYFYYFTAAQKIGVATADNPTGPFTDSGKPLIDRKPEGITRGQEIDPDVFTDPKSGKSYLYWGNDYMAGAELNDDMISLKPGTQQLMKPDATFREGTYVIYRNGTYYFFWSEDDTRSENYRVRYGTSDSPLGKITVPANNVVLEKDKSKGIFGAGHNSVVQIPGRDEWFIVYHRFNYPDGINMGESAGYHREVCIDKLEFNADDSIKKVQPTLEGIKPVSVGK